MARALPASLQKNLTGQFTVGATNLNLSVADVHSAILKTLINVIATIPQLVSIGTRHRFAVGPGDRATRWVDG